MSCAGVTLDAGVLVVPDGDATREDAYHYVEGLLVWLKLLDEPWIAICMSERSSEALTEDSLFPFREHLSELFFKHRIVEFDVNTVATVINRLLMHTPSFETYFGVRDILSEDLSAAPDVLQLGISNGLRSELARCLVLMALLRAHCGNSILNHVLAIRRAPSQLVRVRALVHDIEHQRTDFWGALPQPPKYFEGDVITCDDFVSLLDCIDENALLKYSSDDTGIEVGVRISLYKWRNAQGLNPDWDNVDGWSLGSEFGERTRMHTRGTPLSLSASVLRAINETIQESNFRAVHALRTGPGGNDPQRRRARDNAKAWRRDIDQDYHLHYWEVLGGEVELASVGHHDDFSIPE